jgi:hypothetical protein
MSQRNSAVLTIKSSADLTYPKFTPKMSLLERTVKWKSKRTKALSELALIVQQGLAHEFEDSIKNVDEKMWKRRVGRTADYSVNCARSQYATFTETMQALDRLDTQTLLFIAKAYNGVVTDNYSDWLTSALATVYISDVDASGEDINVVARNTVSYRSHVSWRKVGINAFNDVRLSDPLLNRPDLYNLTGNDREWAKRIMDVSIRSQDLLHVRIRKGETGLTDRVDIKRAVYEASNYPHMTSELALMLKEDPELVDRVMDLMKQRKLTGAEISADFLRDFSSGALSINDGVL